MDVTARAVRRMTKIAFYAQHLSERGTGVALFDYAQQNRVLLGNESVVIYDKDNPANNPLAVDRFAKSFEVIACNGFAEADSLLAREGCDLVYRIKSGKRGGVVSRVVPTMVHGVFPTSTREVHGSAFAFVSDWLARWCAGGLVPSVPHIARIGDTDADMRAQLGIPENALVFGCYGGRDSFDIGFVRDKVVAHVLETQPLVWFLYMNITPFIQHERAIFLPASVDLEAKTAFINTCDAMLHARLRGETFGMAVAEFSLRGKPVLTYAKSRERAHLAMLGDAAMTYRGADDLLRLIREFDRAAPSAQRAYQTLFAPKPVMAQFAANLIEPAGRFGIDGARRGLGIRPYHALRLPISKLAAGLR